MRKVSYIVKGEITHADSMGNTESLSRGEVQYLSAGTGITHSEFNTSHNNSLRLLQIWIVPPKRGVTPLYGSHKYQLEDRKNKLLNIVSSQNGDAKIKIYQDVKIYVCELDANKQIVYSIIQSKQIYFVQIEGKSKVNGIELLEGDALEVVDIESLIIDAKSDIHFLFIEMTNTKS